MKLGGETQRRSGRGKVCEKNPENVSWKLFLKKIPEKFSEKIVKKILGNFYQNFFRIFPEFFRNFFQKSQDFLRNPSEFVGGFSGIVRKSAIFEGSGGPEFDPGKAAG